MARVVRQQDGSYVAVKEDGSRIPVSSQMLAERAQPTHVLNEQGITTGQRFFLKNFSGNEKAAMDYLRSQGYDVRKYGDHPLKMQFAVRKGASDPWRVVDPDGFDPEDLLDLAADAVIGIGMGAATAATGGAGLLAAAGASAAAGGVGEAVRQGIGAVGGMGTENFSPANVGLAAAGGALGEGVGAGISKATGGISKVALDVAARVAGVKASGGIAADEALYELASQKKLFRQLRLPTFREVADNLHKYLTDKQNGIMSHTFPETLEMNTILGNAKQAGVKVDMSDIFSELENYTDIPRGQVVRTSERNVVTEAERAASTTTEGTTNTANRTYNETASKKGNLNSPPEIGKSSGVRREADIVGSKENFGVTERTSSGTTNQTVRRTVTEPGQGPRSLEQARAAVREGNPSPVVKELMDNLMNTVVVAAEQEGVAPDIRAVSPEIANMIRQDLQGFARGKGVYTKEITPGIKQIAKDAASSMRQKLVDTVGAFDKNFAVKLAQVDSKTRARAELVKAMQNPATLRRFIKKVFGEGDSDAMRALMNVEQQFGVQGQIINRIRQAQIGAQVSKKGATPGTLSAFPRLSATGLPVLVPSYMVGGPMGLAAGMAATSPRSVVNITRMGINAAKAMNTPIVTKAMRQAAIQSFRQTALAVGKGIAREPEQPKRRRIVIGGG